MADGRHVAFRRQSAVDVPVPSLHIAQGRAQVGAGRFNDRFPPGDARRLFPDERGDHVIPGGQENAAAGGNRFMPAAQVNAARDFARFIQAGNFGVKGPRQQHGLVSLDGAFLQVRLCSVAMCHSIILYAAWGNAMPFHETSGDFMPAGLNGRSGCTAGRQGRGRGTPVPERRFLHPLHPLPVPEKIPRFTSLPAEGSISVRIWDAPHRSLRKTIPFP